MGLNNNYLICIFMNINENDENQDIQRENLLPFEGLRVEYLQDVPCTLRTNAHGCLFGQRISLLPMCVKIIECSPPPLISRGRSVVHLYYHMFLGY